MSGRDSCADSNDVTNLLHERNFNLLVFSYMIKNGGNCEVITKDVI